MSVAILGVTLAFPATDEDVWGALRFPPTLNGVRCASLGSAGVALVDDATALLTNPSRLPSVRDQEIFFEARAGDPDATRHDSGLRRIDPTLNPFAGSAFEAESVPDGIRSGLLAWVYPFDLSRPVILGVGFQRATGSVRAGASVDTVPLSAPVTPSGGDDVVILSEGSLDETTETLTIGAGWGITPDFWVGASVSSGRLDVEATTTGSLADPLQFTGPGMFDPRFESSAPVPLVQTVTEDSDTTWSWSLGAFFRPHPAVGLATVYRQGPRWELPAMTRNLVTGGTDRFSSTVKVPDRAAVGIAWSPFVSRPSPTLRSLTLVLDVERVTYSDLVEDLVVGQNILTMPDFARSVSYEADDAVEVHAGVEWTHIYRAWSLGVRLGAYTDQNASIALVDLSGDPGALQGQGDVLEDEGFFEPQDPDPHFTGGLGVAFHELVFDLGVDVSDPGSRFLLSTRYRFR